ncbi:MAG: ABC transporter permease subunit [Pseudomonadota bacterium]
MNYFKIIARMSMASGKYPRYRFILNNVASKVFTFFGLLVLVTFTVLIIHLLSNSFPLFHSPKINYIDSYQDYQFDQYIGTTVVAGKPAAMGIKNCRLLNVPLLAGDDRDTADAIRLSCDKQWLPVKQLDTALAIASIDTNGLIEFYRLQVSEQTFRLQLFASFFLPEPVKSRTSFGQHSQHDAAVWSIEVLDQHIYIALSTENGESFIIQKTLHSVEAPSVKQAGQLKHFFPLAVTHYSLLQTQSTTRIVDSANTTIQTFNPSLNKSVFRLPSARGFIVFDETSYTVYGLFNDAGEFKYIAIATHQEDINGIPASIDFDRQTGAIFILTDTSELLILNPNTFEVVYKETIDARGQSLQSVGDFLIMSGQDRIVQYQISNIVGVATWQSLFSPVHYVGYEEKGFIWQTSKVTAYDQAKYNVVPLIIGSIKASLLALVVAVPLAAGSAVFTAYFASEKTRAWLKPGIEMVEAMPSVVIGFVAAIWLAPMADKHLIAILLSVISLPFFMLAGVLTHGFWSSRQFNFRSPRRVLFAGITLLLILLFLVFNLGIYLQQVFVNSNATWAIDLLATTSLSKSAIVVAIALGIAITPSIYSLIDDAINEVPKGAILASFSLGANEVQTLFRVVLVVALPGILSAVMLGFGRAFGETMIVLMVTGNTPMPSWELLDGLRSLTSNLAIELQESNAGSMHFHILFFTASLLFFFTFCVNSLAALLKSRLTYSASNEH